MYIYAIIQTPKLPMTLPRGMMGPLQLVGNAVISAIVEPELTYEDLEQDHDRLLQAIMIHDQVIQAIFLQTPVLPSRFGCFVPINDLLDSLTRQQGRHLETLNQLAGKAEYLIQLTPLPLTEVPVSPLAKGKDYFLAKKRHYQAQVEHQNRQQQELKQLVTEIAARFQFKVGEAQDGTEKLYLLVNQRQEPTLQQQFLEWQQQLTRWQLKLLEAMPPYHFLEH